MHKSKERIETGEEEVDRNALHVKGERYHVIAGAEQGYGMETRSHGYGNAYERDQRVGFLSGSIAVIEQQTGQSRRLQIIGAKWDEGAHYHRHISRDLRSALHAEDIADEALYADVLGKKLWEVAGCAGQLRNSEESADPAYKKGQLTYLNLGVFSAGLKEYLRESGVIPEESGQLRVDTTKTN